MTMPKRKWCFCIVLAFLYLIQNTNSTAIIDNSGRAKDAYKNYMNENEKYEMIDVNQQGGNNANMLTGITTRLFTDGDVNDDFWYKHLGDDFKRAIHMQIENNDSYNEAHKTELIQENNHDQSNSRVNSNTNSNPVEYNKSIADHNRNSKNKNVENGLDKNLGKTKNVRSTTTEKAPEYKTVAKKSNYKRSEKIKRNDPAFVFTIDDAGVNLKKKVYKKPIYNPLDMPNDEHKELKIVKEAEKQKVENSENTDKQEYTSKKPHKFQKYYSRQMVEPVVVNLPDDQKNILNYDANETPIVVRMPPVIYHSQQSYHHEEQTAKNTEANGDQYQKKHENEHKAGHDNKSEQNYEQTFKEEHKHDREQQQKEQQQLHKHDNDHEHEHKNEHKHVQNYENGNENRNENENENKNRQSQTKTNYTHSPTQAHTHTHTSENKSTQKDTTPHFRHFYNQKQQTHEQPHAYTYSHTHENPEQPPFFQTAHPTQYQQQFPQHQQSFQQHQFNQQWRPNYQQQQQQQQQPNDQHYAHANYYNPPTSLFENSGIQAPVHQDVPSALNYIFNKPSSYPRSSAEPNSRISRSASKYYTVVSNGKSVKIPKYMFEFALI